ncbi:hypothetical protein OKW21_000947 [Catalinimonas alkaloidigena]|uniref:hypothetical protein n=1 Tax=Catalinimonas alkaloidigena TaxID=1075417 RepID=UPI0024074832|nr:hypothetical protein [Catalinimonas alkaloidigena]MDF9795684.1 hypothetical protein [Catalinimonas alkaloidigena]
MKKKLVMIGLPLIVLILLIYYFLGGFNQVEIQRVTVDDYYFTGHLYRGPYQEEELKSQFFQMHEYVETGTLNGIVGVLNYDIENLSEDSIQQFIGVILDEKTQQIPTGLEQDTVFANEALRAVIRAHPIVMPNPDQVVDMIRSQARDRGISLKEFSIEQYVGEQEIWVDIPLDITLN